MDEETVSQRISPGSGDLLERVGARLPRLPLRGRYYILAYRRLVQREGERCKGCGTSQGALQIHHRDGDTWNNALGNLELRCSSCNTGENNRLRGQSLDGPSSRGPVCASNEDPGIDTTGVEPSNNLVLYSQRLQRDCWLWLMSKLGPGGVHQYMALRDVVNECAYDIGSHPTTVRRYIEMFATPNGPIRILEQVLPGDRPGRRTKIVVYVGSKLLPGEGRTEDSVGTGAQREEA